MAPDAAVTHETAVSRRSPTAQLLAKTHPIGRAARLLLVAGALTCAFALEVPLCPFALVTRHPCPGCGLTRASLAMLRGDFHAAAHYHPLVFLVTPVIAIVFAYNGLEYVRRGQWFASESKKGRAVTAAWIVFGVAMVGVWVARFFGAFGGPVPV